MIDYAFNPRRLFVLSSFFSRFSLGWIYFNEQRARFAQLKSRVSSWRWSSETFTLFSLHHIQFHYPRLSFAISPLLVACLVPIFFSIFFPSVYPHEESTFVTFRIIWILINEQFRWLSVFRLSSTMGEKFKFSHILAAVLSLLNVESSFYWLLSSVLMII